LTDREYKYAIIYNSKYDEHTHNMFDNNGNTTAGIFCCSSPSIFTKLYQNRYYYKIENLFSLVYSYFEIRF